MLALAFALPVAADAVTPRPSVSGLSPASGPAGGGVRLTVRGSAFRHVEKVLVGGKAAHWHLRSSNRLTVTTPALSPGRHNVRVVTRAGSSARTVRDLYTASAPAVTGLSPASGLAGGGVQVTVRGSAFSHIRTVVLGGKAVHWRLASSTRLVITTPALTPGRHNLRVVTSTAVSRQNVRDLYTALGPQLTGLSPTAGPLAGGTPLIITGLRLDRVTRVYFGPVSTAAVTHLSSTRLQVRTPASAVGTATVRLSGGDGESAAVAAGRYRFTDGPTPPAFGDPKTIDPLRGGVQWVSCPSDGFCVAVDRFGELLTYSGGAWSGPVDVFGVRVLAPFLLRPKVSCSSADFCLAIVAQGTGQFAAWDGTRWSSPQPLTSGSPAAVSCWSDGHCVLTDTKGHWLTYSGGGWSDPASVVPPQVSPTPTLTGLSCISPTFCAAVGDTGAGFVFDGAQWSSRRLTGAPELFSVSCASATFCVATGHSTTDVVYTYRGPADGWSEPVPAAAGNGATLYSVSCPTTTSCVIGGAGRPPESGAVVLDYSDGALGPPVQLADAVAGLTGVSCASVSFCAAVGASGTALIRSSGVWAALPPSDPESADLAAISCPAVDFCAAADSLGGVTAERSGTWDAPVFADPVGVVGGLSCASAHRCVLRDTRGHVSVFDGSGWGTPVLIDPGHLVTGVACPADSSCVAVDSAGQALGFDGRDWTAPAAVAGVAFFNGITCPSTTFCLATGGDAGHRTVAVQWRSGRWGTPELLGNPVEDYPTSLDCASATSCTVGFNDGVVVTWNSGVWSARIHLNGVTGAVLSLTCPATGYCLATEGDNPDKVIGIDGVSARAAAIGLGPTVLQQPMVSCATVAVCTLVRGSAAVHS